MPHVFHASYLISSFLKSKQSIRTAQHDLHVKMCLENKFYIFWKLVTIFLDRYKIIIFRRSRNSDTKSLCLETVPLSSPNFCK